MLINNPRDYGPERRSLFCSLGTNATRVTHPIHSHLGRQTLIFELQEGIIDPNHHYAVLELQSIHNHKSTINEPTIASPLVQQAVSLR